MIMVILMIILMMIIEVIVVIDGLLIEIKPKAENV